MKRRRGKRKEGREGGREGQNGNKTMYNGTFCKYFFPIGLTKKSSLLASSSTVIYTRARKLVANSW